MFSRTRFANVYYSFSLIYFEVLKKKIAPVAFICMYPFRQFKANTNLNDP